MKVVNMRALEGPNVYLRRPVLVVNLELENLTERESSDYPGFVDRLLNDLPGLADHYCGLGRAGGFVERLQEGTYFGHIVEHVTLEFEHMLGYEVIYGRTRIAGRSGFYEVVVEIESKPVAMKLFTLAVDYVTASVEERPFALAEHLQRVRQLQNECDLGPSTKAIVQAAKARKVPWRRIGEQSLVQLGTGKYRKWIKATLTGQTSAIAVDIASDKALTKQLLKSAGIAVPRGGVATSFAEAQEWFAKLTKPIVVKPMDGCQGKGVTVGIIDADRLSGAYDFASHFSSQILVEEQVTGKQYRLLVVGDQLVAAAERVPAHVVGDGESTIAQLIEITNMNPLRGDDHEKPLTKIQIDQFLKDFLAYQERALDQIPAQGEVVFLRDSANLSTGGIALDVTNRVHPNYVKMAIRAAQMVGLDVCGVDLIAPEISTDTGDGAIIEVNAAPGIRMHHFPSIGEAQGAGEAILDSMFPSGSITHVPLVSVTGTNGKTTTTRLIAHILKGSGRTVGMTTTDGVLIGDQKIWSGDASGPQSARLVLQDPTIDVAVLETARGGIIREGLGYDLADVAVMTNITSDHIGQDGLETIADIAHVKALVAECVRDEGAVVLNADDEELVKLSKRLNSRVIWISMHADNPVLKKHLKAGGQAFFVDGEWLVEGAGALLWPLVRIHEIPLTIRGIAGFHVANVLCSVAATRQLGISRAQCKQGILSFEPFLHNPGRVQMYQLPSGLKVILDYGHNEDGMRAVGEMARLWFNSTVPAVIGFPGDRNDHSTAAAARMAARYFSPVVVKEDIDLRGRRPGEIAQIIIGAIKETNPETPAYEVLSEVKALEFAINKFSQHEAIVMFYEKLSPLTKLLESLGAEELRLQQALHAMIQAR